MSLPQPPVSFRDVERGKTDVFVRVHPARYRASSLDLCILVRGRSRGIVSLLRDSVIGRSSLIPNETGEEGFAQDMRGRKSELVGGVDLK